ncbi:hypothetical protein [Candidatus Thiothrix anitrata]|uniref:Uncharacterized protein n=1 Tax=Candidatus Thiothrix anitrata TaxID=2823902 RepID=A0ABX7X590_9GAMM|nr:hypothetical protein [Candidatus Thiothrix anitrata]QTR51054.1 hypothetical protein J8380_05705 [Candidatus Thiothrix anitrata]
MGNAITELLGIVVKRQVDSAAYAAVEEGLVSRLLDVRERLLAANLGEAIAARVGLTVNTKRVVKRPRWVQAHWQAPCQCACRPCR